MLCTSRTLLAVALFSLFAAGTIVATEDAIPPLPINPGEYSIRNLDGSHVYGESHGIEVGVDVTFSHYEDCLAVYTTRAWNRPLGTVAKNYGPKTGKIEWDLCEEDPLHGWIHSASRAGLVGEFFDNDDGTYIADYSENGGNTRLWQPL